MDGSKDYSSDPQNLVSVLGLRNVGTGNWRFFFPMLHLTRDASLGAKSARSATVAFKPVKHGALTCVVCKLAPDACTCPE